jgi:hypothetical protein
MRRFRPRRGAAKALSYDLGDEGRAIFDDVVRWKGTRQDEGLAVDPSEAGYRWRECSRMQPGAVPKTHGSLIEDAKSRLRKKPGSGPDSP